MPGRHALQAVVPHGRRRIQAFLHFSGIQQFSLIGRVSPDTRETVCLQFKVNREVVRSSRIPFLRRMYSLFDSDQFLDVVADLMREHIGFRKLSRSSEPLFQFIVEAQIDVHLLITGTVERPTGGLRHTASGIDTVAEQHQLGVPVLDALGAEGLGPSLLRIVEHEGDELHQRLLSLIAGCVWLPAHMRGRVDATAHSHQRKKIALKHETQHQQDDETSNADMQAAKAKPAASTSTAAIISAIFYVLALSARCPTHGCSPVENEAEFWSFYTETGGNGRGHLA